MTDTQKWAALRDGLAAIAQAGGLTLKENEPLSKHVSYRIGGAADLFAKVETEAAMLAALKLVHRVGAPLLIIGNGTNILIADRGVRGLVIRNAMDAVTLTPAPDGQSATLKAGSGAVLGAVARRVAKAGWSGFEFSATIPGSVGGGVVNNAGAHGGDFSQVMTRVAVATVTGDEIILTPDQMELQYRHSRWRRQVGMGKVAVGTEGNELILWAEFRLHKGDPAASKAIIDEQTHWRREKQPQEPNAGSFFKNPPGHAAGRLIEAAGLKGHSIGGAQISPRHANFIVNTGGATAADVLALADLARRTVYDQTGITLEPEVEMLGDFESNPFTG